MRSRLIFGALPALLAVLFASPAQADIFELTSVTASRTTVKAGEHPDLDLTIRFCDFVPFGGSNPPPCRVNDNPRQERLKDMIIKTPAGLLGNTFNLPYCEYAQYLAKACPANTKVGTANGLTSLGPGIDRTTPGSIYNMRPVGDQPARFGAIINPNGDVNEPAIWQPTIFSVRTNGDFGLDALSPLFFNELPIGSAIVPAKIRQIDIHLFGSVAGKPFLTNPTSCDPNAEVRVDANSYESPQNLVTKSAPLVTTDCGSVPFTPSIDVDTDNDQAGQPAGYTVAVNLPDTELDPVHGAALKNAVVTLPEGVKLSPTAAHELTDCSESQVGIDNSLAPNCPSASDIGDVRVWTPLLDGDTTDFEGDVDPLDGDVYFATPTPSEPWKIWVVIEDGGLRIKLPGKVDVDTTTGRITTTFLNNPETPFTRFELKLRGGDNAVLLNPEQCGTYSLQASFSPWSGTPDVDATDVNSPDRSFEIGSNCPPSPKPFAPTITASTNPKNAASPTKAQLLFNRPDGDQLVKRLDIALPPGLVGSLAKLPLCPKASALAGSCSDDSLVGGLRVTVGPGAGPIVVPGQLFLSEPLNSGDAAGLVAKIPAKVGPIDLGQVVVPNYVRLRQSDAGLDVASAAFPTSLGGVPIAVRKIEINVDREGFMQNPSSCELKAVNVAFTSDQDAVANASASDAATDCGAVPFAPHLRLIAGGPGSTGRFSHTPLKAIVTQGPGESAISGAEVVLPGVLRPDTVNLNKPGALCNDQQLAAGSCPAGSRAGTASVHSPLLPEPLTGPVYLVQFPGNPLPKLSVQLSGAVSLNLSAQNSIRGFRTVNTFTGLPDVPQSRFELNIDGGATGILKNFESLCTTKQVTADASFSGHSGATYSEHPKLDVEGCGASAKAKATASTKRAKASKRGIVKIKVSCSDAGPDCDGKLTLRSNGTLGKKKFSIASGGSKAVGVKLSRKALARLRTKRKLNAKATVAVDGTSTTKKLTIKK